MESLPISSHKRPAPCSLLPTLFPLFLEQTDQRTTERIARPKITAIKMPTSPPRDKPTSSGKNSSRFLRRTHPVGAVALNPNMIELTGVSTSSSVGVGASTPLKSNVIS